MKTKIVKLQFAVIVEVEDNATQEQIMGAAARKMYDIQEDGQFDSEFLNQNNLIGIEDYFNETFNSEHGFHIPQNE